MKYGRSHFSFDFIAGHAVIHTRSGSDYKVDVDDLLVLTEHHWYGRKNGYATAMADSGREVFMHRLLMGDPAGMVVDHINGDRKDNRRVNLRVCTQGENSKNRGGARKKTLPVGVFKSSKNSYHAKLKTGATRLHLGSFSTPEEASAAYQEAAARIYGDFHRKTIGANKNV